MEHPTKTSILFLLGSLLLAAIFIALGIRVFNSSELAHSPRETPLPRSIPASGMGAPSSPSLLPPNPPDKERVASLGTMTRILSEFAAAARPVEDLMAALKAAGQEPFLVRDRNEYTGEMIFVRTKHPLPGTRYFHAQYFVEEDGGSFPQHMSFEFQPGPQALEQAVAAVHAAFPGLGEPSQHSPDFLQWSLGHGYVLWIQRLQAEDLAHNPFNAYTEADQGSLRLAVELEVEAHPEP